MDTISWINTNQGFFLVVLTFLYVLATAVIVYVMYRSNRIASRSVAVAEQNIELSRKALSADQRPWVMVEPSLHYPVNLDRNGDLHIPLGLRLKNVGKTPALNIWWPMEVHIRIVGEAAWDVQKAYCTEKRETYQNAQVGDRNFAGVTLFPGQERVAKVQLQISADVIASDTKKFSGSRKPILVVGCVLYRGGLHFDAYQTWFIFEAFHPPVSGIDIDPAQGSPGEHGSMVFESAEINRFFVGDYAD
jgi:hypothetical protein